nr:uncharacterized protein LOC105340815 isoform X1 [Crassostrea gigas]
MAFDIFAGFFLFIFGVVLFRDIDGSQCNNPFDKLFKNNAINVKQLLERVLNKRSWSKTIFSADDFITAENNCERNANCRIELLLQYNNQLELCFWPDQKTCFLLTCMCTKDNITEDSSGGFKCTHLKKVMLQEVEQINTTDERSRVENDHERNCITAIDNCNNTREKENSDNIYTTISELILQNKDRKRYLLPVALTFIVGTVFGSAVSIITIHLCRSRTLRQIQNHQQTDLCGDTPLHMKFSGETSEYSEIQEYSRNKLGAGFREYLEPLPKNNTVSRETIPLENLYEKDESSQYQEVSLDRGNANHNIYHHLQPNNSTNQQVPIKKEESSVNPLYDTLALVDRENKVDINSDENSRDAAPSLLNDNSPSNSDAKTEHIQKDEISSGSPYLMCENKEQITEKVETDEGSDELKVNSNIDNTYFVLQKKE